MNQLMQKNDLFSDVVYFELFIIHIKIIEKKQKIEPSKN